MTKEVERQNIMRKLMQDVESERKKALKSNSLSENKIDLERFVSKIYYFYKMMRESSIQEVAKKSGAIIGMAQIIEQSNEKLNYIRNEIASLKANPNDEVYEILSHILEMAMDNLYTRITLNEYIGGLLLQVGQKAEDYQYNFK
jgi:hypothetical protein